MMITKKRQIILSQREQGKNNRNQILVQKKKDIICKDVNFDSKNIYKLQKKRSDRFEKIN